MQLYAGATNEQYLDNILKQTYSMLEPILVNKKFHKAIYDCVKWSIEKNDKDLEDLVKECKDYSFITFFKDLYLFPKHIDYIPSYLLIIIILLLIIFFILAVITFNLLFNQK
tara:strand:- start:955 stop:1290 length:336 start_codon:yes stop_codon:yes gene_type:complete